MPHSPLSRVGSFLRELKRRKVYRVTAIYVVLAIGGLEILDLLIPSTRLPEWASPLLVGLAIAGLPTVIVLAWAFDVTPSGVVKTEDEEPAVSRQGRSSGAPGGTVGGPDKAAESPSTVDGQGNAADDRTHSAVDVPDRLTDKGSADGLDPLTVAVLPFDNLSGSDDAQPFVVGLHDDLLTELSRASALTVISRTSVRGYRDSTKGVREIARELGSGTIVEGGVQKVGNRVRLNIQLIDARTDVHRWAERYDCELTAETIFDLQSRLASSIMEALEAQLTSAEQARSPTRPTDDLEAYRLYSLGRDTAVDRSADGLRGAIDYFQRAIDRDPKYAQAWAALGMALIMFVGYGHADDQELVDRGKAACFRAVELDPELPEAHAAVGNLYGHLQDAPAARAALSVAVRLGPGLAIGHQRSGWVHLMAGDPERAAESSRKATHLAPLEPEARSNLAMATLALGDPDGAESEARRALESHPDFSYGRWVLALSLLTGGQMNEARGELDTIREERYRPWGLMVDGLRLVRDGDPSVEDVVRKIQSMGASVQAGIIRAARGDLDGALTAIESSRPFFWDAILLLRYWQGDAVAELRRVEGYYELIRELDRSWGVEP